MDAGDCPASVESEKQVPVSGGEGGIRTHGRLRDTRSPGAPDRPLQHLSAERVGFEPTVHCCTPLFESGTISHSVTSPNERDYNIRDSSDLPVVPEREHRVAGHVSGFRKSQCNYPAFVTVVE